MPSKPSRTTHRRRVRPRIYTTRSRPANPIHRSATSRRRRRTRQPRRRGWSLTLPQSCSTALGSPSPTSNWSALTLTTSNRSPTPPTCCKNRSHELPRRRCRTSPAGKFSRLSAAVTPRIEALRFMTGDAFRTEIALDARTCRPYCRQQRRRSCDDERRPQVRDRVRQAGRRTGDEGPCPPASARCRCRRRRGVRHLRDAARLHPEAEHYAASAPIDLVDGASLIRSMHRSRKGMLLPASYKAMCCQCGEIVQHRLDKGDALPCRNGHRSRRRLPARRLCRTARHWRSRAQPRPMHRNSPHHQTPQHSQKRSAAAKSRAQKQDAGAGGEKAARGYISATVTTGTAPRLHNLLRDDA